MRWLMLCLLVSLAALLIAAAAAARHIWVHHKKLHREPPSRIDSAHDFDHEA